MKTETPRREIEAFLTDAGLVDFEIQPLAGDASLRSYWRIRTNKTSLVLMDAPPNTGEDTAPFLSVGRWLLDQGLSAPKIVQTHKSHGLVLMEDLGDAIYARHILAQPTDEAELYEAATEVLVTLANQEITGDFPAYTPTDMAKRAGLAGTWYAGDPSIATVIETAVAEALGPIEQARKAVALRDYHAENLIWLAERQGLARVGLLDFQDAMIAPLGYDLVSLLHDARRDISPDIREPLKQQYQGKLGLAPKEFTYQYHVLLAQRSLRIIGVFARLSLHFAKPSYIDLLPRVWLDLTYALSHPELGGLARACRDSLPAPTETILQDLKARCGTK